MCGFVCVCVFAVVLLSAKQIALAGIIKVALTLSVLKSTACLLRTQNSPNLTSAALFQITFCLWSWVPNKNQLSSLNLGRQYLWLSVKSASLLSNYFSFFPFAECNIFCIFFRRLGLLAGYYCICCTHSRFHYAFVVTTTTYYRHWSAIAEATRLKKKH